MREKTKRVFRGRNWFGRSPLAHVVWNGHNPNNPYRKGMVVHHKDENKLNDDISNLELMTKSEHLSLHKNATGHIVSESSKKVMSEKAKGRKLSEETKLKMSLSRKGLNTWTKGRIVSVEERLKKSESLKGRISPMKGKEHSEETKNKVSLAIKKHWEIRRLRNQNAAL